MWRTGSKQTQLKWKLGSATGFNGMTSFLLQDQELDFLRDLGGQTIRQLVWDINAVYVCGVRDVIKIEAQADCPLGDASSGEVVYLSVGRDESGHVFEQPTPAPFAYALVASETSIDWVALVRTTVLLPSEVTRSPKSRVPTSEATFQTDCGVLLGTARGVLPAVQFGNSFGFMYLPGKRLYSPSEVEMLIGSEYEVIALDP
jgi:hypothetical protein